MKLSQFKFKLPEELIAQTPSEERDEARMMVLQKQEKSSTKFSRTSSTISTMAT